MRTRQGNRGSLLVLGITVAVGLGMSGVSAATERGSDEIDIEEEEAPAVKPPAPAAKPAGRQKKGKKGKKAQEEVVIEEDVFEEQAPPPIKPEPPAGKQPEAVVAKPEPPAAKPKQPAPPEEDIGFEEQMPPAPAVPAAPAPVKLSAQEQEDVRSGKLNLEEKVRMDRWNKLKESIFSKMAYDRTYFSNVLNLKPGGPLPPKWTPELLAEETRRAEVNLPVVKLFHYEKDAYEKGTPFTLPQRKDLFRVYTNLMAILNLIQDFQKGNIGAALETGNKVVVVTRENLGLVRDESVEYYVGLYREFFYLMANMYFLQNQDSEAVRWIARLETDAELQALRRAMDAEKSGRSGQQARVR